jgi:hypothetical protein
MGGEEEPIQYDIEEVSPYEFARSKCKSVILPNAVKTIGNEAFYHCDELESITIPKSVTKIGDGAFNCCENLKNIYYEGSPQDWAMVAVGKENKKLSGVFGKANIYYNHKK